MGATSLVKVTEFEEAAGICALGATVEIATSAAAANTQNVLITASYFRPT
jgi:hypothetical protein